jgi:hypothetical protein
MVQWSNRKALGQAKAKFAKSMTAAAAAAHEGA